MTKYEPRPGETGAVERARGLEALGARLLQVVHRPRAAVVEPALEGGAVREPGGPDGHPVEAQLERARLHRLGERQADECHAFLARTCRCARVSVRPPSSRNLM